MKKILALLLCMTMVFALAACGGTATPTVAPTDEPTGEPTGEPVGENVITKVALVTDVGTIDDESFNQGTWEGVVAFGEATGIECTYYQPTADSAESRALSITQAINDGANVIVLPGYLFGENVIEMPAQYPDVYFIAIDVGPGDLTYDYETYYEPAENAVCITFSEEQAGFLAGYAAVMDGYTNLGFLGGMAVPAVIRYGYGFVQGADFAANELDVDVSINYFYGGQFFPDADITARMEGWYQNGTEVVFACGGGIYGSAVEAALIYDGKVIGVDVDQHYVGENENYAYNPFITSAMKRLSVVTEDVLSELNGGNWDAFGGRFINYSLADGDVVGLPTVETSWGLETFTVENYDAVVAKIIDGTIAIDNSSDTEVKPEVSERTSVNYVG